MKIEAETHANPWCCYQIRLLAETSEDSALLLLLDGTHVQFNSARSGGSLEFPLPRKESE